MKVETPQILWNAEDGGGTMTAGKRGVNAALLSVSVLRSGIVNDDRRGGEPGHVLATAGNTPSINLWKMSFADRNQNNNNNNKGGDNSNDGTAPSSSSLLSTPPTMPRASAAAASSASSVGINGGPSSSSSWCKTEYLCSLTRHETAVNTVAFSPDGLHLATGSDSGAILVWSVPVRKRGNDNGRHFWSALQKESELTVRVVNNGCTGICDISWSADSKRFVAGTIDHAVLVCEDANYGSSPLKEADWRVVFQNGMDHTHYVVGVGYDPQGAYLATMSNDRTVRVYPRKAPPKSKKKVLRPANSGSSGSVPPADHQRAVSALLTDSRIELSKSRQLKYRKTPRADGSVQKQLLYVDEPTLDSFVRRLAWTADGAFLITPAALWHKNRNCGDGGDDANGDSGCINANVDRSAADDGGDPNRRIDPQQSSSSSSSSSSPSFATCLFARHKWDEPCRVLQHGMDKVRIILLWNRNLCAKSPPVSFFCIVIDALSLTLPGHYNRFPLVTS